MKIRRVRMRQKLEPRGTRLRVMKKLHRGLRWRRLPYPEYCYGGLILEKSVVPVWNKSFLKYNKLRRSWMKRLDKKKHFETMRKKYAKYKSIRIK